MDIQQSVIHGVIKEKDTSGPDSVSIKPRESLLPLDNRVIKLATDVLALYGKLSNGYGMLGDDFEVHRFPNYLHNHLDNRDDFLTFTNKAMAVMAEQMSQQRFATTSYPIFFRYTNLGREWLLIAVLKLKEGVGIDEETLDLNDSLFFDISNLREAARIDIEKWRNNEQPYLSFIKRGSGTDSESSRYFREALSCLDYTDAKYNTATVLRAVDEYCENQGWGPEQRQQARSATFDYCKAKKASDEPVNLTALSALINDQVPASFVNYVRENDYQVSETFSPHPDSYKKFQRLSKRFGSINLGFDIDDLVAQRVYYDDDDNAIVLRNPPEDLINDILKAQGISRQDDE